MTNLGNSSINKGKQVCDPKPSSDDVQIGVHSSNEIPIDSQDPDYEGVSIDAHEERISGAKRPRSKTSTIWNDFDEVVINDGKLLDGGVKLLKEVRSGGQKLMMMGTAEEAMKAPEKNTVFMEDLTEDQQVVAVVFKFRKEQRLRSFLSSSNCSKVRCRDNFGLTMEDQLEFHMK
ncbi:Ubiquitin carboxyl-terminal hydrolase 7 [Nymphaea thermarum]|nr:Ubiquitin carboxyl-terminal hydrolase 7 [Nymphaea thermarum]